MDNTAIPADLLHKWRLATPSLIADTPTSYVYRVQQEDGNQAVFKLLKPEGLHERAGFAYLAWREGLGAVRMIHYERNACLLEDAGAETLAEVQRRSGDDAATKIISELLTKLHAPSTTPAPTALVPLDMHFGSLFRLAQAGGIHHDLAIWAVAQTRMLLANQIDVVPLHGDLHHDNILKGNDGNWRAIDPQGLIGDRAYEVANVFGNPSGKHLFDPARILNMAELFSVVLGCSATKILQFAGVHALLSVAWSLDQPERKDAAANILERTTVASLIRSLIEERSV